jgi:hypothetical protein
LILLGKGYSTVRDFLYLSLSLTETLKGVLFRSCLIKSIKIQMIDGFIKRVMQIIEEKRCPKKRRLYNQWTL